jgi:hypothetical protein
LFFSIVIQGIEPLLDHLFSFLRRKTDFFVGASPEVIQDTVNQVIQKHAALSAKAEADKKAAKEKSDKAAKLKKEKEAKLKVCLVFGKHKRNSDAIHFPGGGCCESQSCCQTHS